MKSFRLLWVISMLMLMSAGAAWAGLHDAPYTYAFLGWSTTVDDWTNSGTTSYATGHDAPNSVRFDNTADYIISPTIDNPDTMKVWLKGNSTLNTGSFKVYAQQGTNGFVEIRNCVIDTAVSGDIRNNNWKQLVIALGSPFRGAQDVSFKFLYELKTVGNVALDDFATTAVGVGDTIPPAISSITVLNNTAIDVLFSESVELLTSQTVANYTVNNGVGHPLSAVRDAVTPALVHLSFASIANNSYVLTVNGVSDVNGNVCHNITGNFVVNVTVAAGDVVINEIMYDDTAAVDAEWVELHNRTGNVINMSGWILTDAPNYPPTTEGAIQIPQGTTIAPHGYLVVSRDVLPGITGYIQCNQYYGTWALGNTGDNVALFTDSTNGTLVDGSLSTNYPDWAASNAGNSIEKCDENSVWSPDSSAWHVSTNVFATEGRYRHCTPGTTNTVCVTDTTRPTLQSATPSGPNQVDVTFSEDVDQITAETATNYSVNLGVGTPTSALRQPNTAVVRLTFSAVLSPNTYTLTVNNVRDLAGNSILGGSQIPFTVMPRPANFVFTEIMPNPSMPGLLDSLGEWFEIYNAGNTAVDLNGWLVCDNAGCDSIEGQRMVNPGQYFVFCSNGDNAVNGGVPYDYAYQYGTSGWGLSLNNTGDSLTIKDALGTVAATLKYTATYPFSEGRAAQLRDVTWNPAVDTNWCRADTSWPGAVYGDKGTPQHATICPANSGTLPYTICDIRQQDQFGVSVLDQQRVITQGVVTYEDSCRRNAYIELNGCAVMIYGNAIRDTILNSGGRRMRVGDLVQVNAYLHGYRGLSELDSLNGVKPIITLLATNQPLPSPITVTPAQVGYSVNDCSPEPYEARHVRIQHVTFPNGGDSTFTAGTSGRNYTVYSGTDSLIFRVVPCDTLVGDTIPRGEVTLNCIVSQFDNTSPYCGGYQMVTGRLAPFSSGQCSTPVQCTAYRDGLNNRVILRWQPGVNQECDCYEIWYATDATSVFPTSYTLLNHVIGTTTYTDTDPLATRRFYVVRAGGQSCP